MAGDQPWQEIVVSQVCEKLLSRCVDMEAAFRVFDTNGDGTVEYSVRAAMLVCFPLATTSHLPVPRVL